jgi:hypothetical protein
MIPSNSVAETIIKLGSDNEFYLNQVSKNLELIEQLEPLAEWTEQQVIETLNPDSAEHK